MPPIEIAQSRWTSFVQIAGATLVSALAIANLTGGAGRPSPVSAIVVLVTAFVATLPSVAALLRPRILRIDGAGFSVSGGIGVKPVSLAWSEAGRFVVTPRGRNNPVINYSLILGHDPTEARPFDARTRGPQQTLPAGWSQSPQAVVDLLNSYRAHANGTA